MGHKWRLELETKGSVAEELWAKHHSRLREPGFCARYCVAQWKSSGFSWPLDGFTEDIELVSERNRKPTPPFGLALWLQSTVRPTIPRLLTVFSVAEVIEMLGLTDAVNLMRREDAECRIARND